VADEPVSALDPPVQAQIINLLLDLRDSLELAYLFITHDLRLVEHLCDRVAVMYLGRIVEEGPAAEVYTDPAHPYTRALLQSVPSLEPGRQTPAALSGELPSAAAVPIGCRFHTRCPVARPDCSITDPGLEPCGPNRRVACHLVDSS
jgi:oligopeptide/dipeptide ABC transporter ATP-binding protein